MAALGTAAPGRSLASQRISNPNCSGKAPRALFRPSCSSRFPRFEATFTARLAHLDPDRGCLQKRCLRNRLVSVDRRISRWLALLASSHEESGHSDIEVDKDMDKLKIEAKNSQEGTKNILECSRGMIKKIHELSLEMHGLYNTKIATLVTDESIKAHFLILKGIKKTLHLIDEMKEMVRIRDFNLGFPYGVFLIYRGYLTFIVSGRFSAMWFGCHLGCVLLQQSALSFRSWKTGQSSLIYLKRQAVIMTIISMWKWWSCYKNYSFHDHFEAIISGTMVLFYLYWTMVCEPKKGTRSEGRNLVVKKRLSDMEVEKNMDELKIKGDESLEEATKTSKNVNEAIRKMQDMSQKIYGSYAKITKLLTNETGIEAPFPLLKDLEKVDYYWINEVGEILGVRDLYIGIPYGIFLFIWGFITFLCTRYFSALWFGCYLGYVLINKSISSYRSRKRGLSYERAFCWQFVIAITIFLRFLFSESDSFQGYFLRNFSGAMLFYYILINIEDEEQAKQVNSPLSSGVATSRHYSVDD